MKSDHRQIHVGLEERDADLARGGVDVGVGEPALATQVLERRGEAVLQGVEHERPYVGYWTDSAY